MGNEQIIAEMQKSSIWIDAYGAEYSADRLTLLKGPQIPSLSEYRIEKGTRVIGYKAFSELSFLQTIDIPDSVTIIEDSAFSACTSLQAIHIPNSVTKIGVAAFSKCTSLQTIHIPDSVTIIEDDAFSGCTSLQSINIPSSVIKIGREAFSGCTSLQSICIWILQPDLKKKKHSPIARLCKLLVSLKI